MAYTGYDEAKIKRDRAIAEAMFAAQLQNRGPVQHWTQGAARLLQAHFGREGLKRAGEAEAGLAANKKSVADAMFSAAFPGDVSMSAYPDEFSQEQRDAGALNAEVRGLADLTGDAAGALFYGRDRQQDAVANALAKAKAEREGIIVAPGGSTGYAPNGHGGYNEIFTAPDVGGNSPAGRVHSVLPDKEGNVRAVMGDAAVRDLGFVAQDSLRTVDIGGVPNIFSGYGRGGVQPVTTPQEVGETKGIVAAGEAAGKRQEQAKADLPNEIANAQNAVTLLKSFKAHPGFKDAYGLNTYLPPIRGSNRSNAEAIREQITSQAFINSIKGITGLAPLTEAEGKKLTNAQTILGTPNISEAQASTAVDDLVAVLESQMQRAQGRASTGPLQRRRVRDRSGAEYDVELRNGQWVRVP